MKCIMKYYQFDQSSQIKFKHLLVFTHQLFNDAYSNGHTKGICQLDQY